MWKLPRRLFNGPDAVDVDDFNETLYEFGSESARVTDQNCSEDVFGSTDADRVTYMGRGASGYSSNTETTYNLAGALPLLSGATWTTVQSLEHTMGDGVLRISGYMGVHGSFTEGELVIRVNGTPIYESRSPMFGVVGNSAFAQIRVPSGTHFIELVVRHDSAAGVSAARCTLTTSGFER